MFPQDEVLLDPDRREYAVHGARVYGAGGAGGQAAHPGGGPLPAGARSHV